MPVSEATYRRLAEEDFESTWELVCGRLRQKPGMTLRHNTISRALAHELERSLPSGYLVAYNTARLRLPSGDHDVPDVVVLDAGILERHWDDSGVEAYSEPAALVVEVLLPSTGDYDAAEKLAGYQARGDAEIGLIDPVARSVTAFVRTSQGTYGQTESGRRRLRLTSIPGVEVDVDRVFTAARL